MCDNYDELSEYEKREIYDYEVYKPLCIEQAIQAKNLRNIRDEISIYALGVDKVLEDKNLMFFKPYGVNKMIHFLDLAVRSNNLHVLRTVWNYGIEYYYNKKSKYWSEVLIYISDLIYEKENFKALKFLIGKIDMDNRKFTLRAYEKKDKWSGAKRTAVIGNLLDAAIYYNNNEVIEFLIPKQIRYHENTLKSYLENYSEEDIDTTTQNPRNKAAHMFYSVYSRDVLCSPNPTAYAIDNGNTEALDILSEYGYRLEFDSLDFSYQLANFGHSKTIKYIQEKYPNEIIKLDIKEVLRATNIPLLRIMLDKGYKLKSSDFNQLFIQYDYSNGFYDNTYKKMKEENIEECVLEFVKRNIRTSNITLSILYALSIDNYNLLALSLSLYNRRTMDVTPIISSHKFSIEVLKLLSKKVELYCNADRLVAPHIRIRDFQNICTLVKFHIAESKNINDFTKHILGLNSINGLKFLLKYKFITVKNYYDAIDFIAENGLEKLLSSLIIYTKDIGGLKKDYVF
jgi:hypothetical protein